MRSLLRSAGLAVLVLAARALAAPVPAEAPPLPVRPGHPRLLLTDEALAAAVAAARTDPLRAALHARIVAAAEENLAEPPVRDRAPGEDLLEQARTAVRHIVTGAMAYRLSHDERFAARARRDLLTVAAFPDWNPAHFLDVAEMSFAVAVGYDWLYAQLSPADRATLAAALRGKSLAFAGPAYAPGGPTDPQLWWAAAPTNWNQVCNAGLLTAALALADEEPALVRTVVAGARASLPLALAAYGPDGAFPEGPGYWAYGTTYTVIALASLEAAVGGDFGLGATPGLDRTARYRLAVQGPTGQVFNYADSADTVQTSPAYAWLAARYRDAAALEHSRTLLAAAVKGRKIGNRFFALHALWFPAESPTAVPRPPLDFHFRGLADLALFRSAWDDPRALFVGFKAGTTAEIVHHAHLDLGSFVLDADGQRWAVDLGPDTYSLPGYFDPTSPRWAYLRNNNHGHNTPTPGRALQRREAAAPLTAFGSAPDRAFAVADLAPVYPEEAHTLRRGVALLDRARVLVQDEFQPARAGTPLHWQMLTGAKIALSADGRTATLTQADRTLRVEVLAPAGVRFDAGPVLPANARENQNPGIAALRLEVTPTSAAALTRVAVLLTPVGDRWPVRPAPELTPLDGWR
ncbi:MAG: heparinase II/III family protein [Verrucomicrobia bacterium]|nr:heparinase II/III family protein [Verrucomicrobiota bacterium]